MTFQENNQKGNKNDNNNKINQALIFKSQINNLQSAFNKTSQGNQNSYSSSSSSSSINNRNMDAGYRVILS
jgi:hypothetical protein